jgi:aspartate dehydrogenase
MLAQAIRSGRAGNARLVAVLVSSRSGSTGPLEAGTLRAHSFDRFLDADVDLVIEAASQAAVKRYGRKILQRGRDLMVLSVGALADDAFLAELTGLAGGASRQLLIPSGAIGGLDALQAAAMDEISEVILTTTKPPHTIFRFGDEAGLPDLTSMTGPVCLFEGPASEAVARFPRNVNVAAALSIAALGFEKTTVRLIADPAARHNTHRVQAKGRFGELDVALRLNPSPTNPQTSYLAALSAIHLLRKLTEPLRLGG